MPRISGHCSAIEHAQVDQYDFYKTIAKPNQQDKEFIINCINEKTGGGGNPLTPAVVAPSGLSVSPAPDLAAISDGIRLLYG